MVKYKAGLHKKISMIFDGVPLQEKGCSNKSPKTQSQPVPKNQVKNSKSVPRTQKSKELGPEAQEPIRKLYKDTVDEQHKEIVKVESQLKEQWSKFYRLIKDKLLTSKTGIDPKRQATSLILIPLLSVILIFILVRAFGTNATAGRKVLEDLPSKNAGINSHTINWRIPEPYSAQLRDPMRIAPSAGRWAAGSGDTQSDRWLLEDGRIILRGIVHGQDNATAVIGMQIVKQGDTIGDITILKINKDNVLLEKNGQQKTLKVGQSWLLSE